MTLLGNLFLGIASLIVFGLASMLLNKQYPPSGDSAVGYAWTLIMGQLAFIICMAIVTAIIGWKGGFSWVGTPGFPRFFIVTVVFILIMLGNGFFTMREGMGALPTILRPVIFYTPVILPFLLLISAAILLNDNLRMTLPAVVYKIPILLGLITGIMAVGLLMAQANLNANARLRSESEFIDRTHQNHLNTIDSTDVMKNMVFLLVFTDANHDTDVRDRALAKIKSRVDWQEELARRLETDWAPEVFTFLASNEVDDKALFAEPVQKGAFIQARLIRESIRNCRGTYDLYSSRFAWEAERVLRTLEKFEGMGLDYRPAVQEMRAALDEPTSFEKPKLECKSILDKWLKTHQNK